MGVPHLITHLRPFATSIDLTNQSAVIDGPALAYHVWYICLSLKPEARSPFEASPSYRLLGETAIGWLDNIQFHNVRLKKILFDGLLPDSKRPTRISRITGYTKQLNDYNQAWPQMIPSSHLDVSTHAPDVKSFNIRNPPANITRLPAVPFLVPAIIEALSQCERYAHLAEVVPGEADLYCADYVKAHGGIVLTADSDLLLHNLGDGAVCFFKDIEFTTSIPSNSIMGIQYQTKAIVQKLGLEKAYGLQALAFEMTMDAHASFRELLQRSAKLNAVLKYGSIYEKFVSEFKSLHYEAAFQDTCDIGGAVLNQSLSCQLKTIDPRISEYLFQFSDIYQATGLPESLHARFFSHHNNIDVFLPFLLDCPLRTSAWEMSTAVRQLAYGLVNMIVTEEKTVLKVTEYRRLQNGSRGKEWEVPNVRDLLTAITDLQHLLEKVKDGLPSQLQKRLWYALALYQDQELNLGSVKPALSTSLIDQPEGCRVSPSRLTWDAVHLYAQFQGSYYSFRILKQILSVILICVESTSVPLALHSTHTILQSLPALNELPTAIDAMRDFGSSDNQLILKMIQGLLGIQTVVEEIKVRKNRKRKKRKSGHSSKGLNIAEIQQQETNNIFNHLPIH